VHREDEREDSMSEFVANPELYRKLDQPFETMQLANAELDEFLRGLRELRERHKIPDVYCAIRIRVKADNGAETAAYSGGGIGNRLEWEGMLAYCLGMEQADRQQRIGELLTGKVLTRKSPR
jgi:hypothetical protein